MLTTPCLVHQIVETLSHSQLSTTLNMESCVTNAMLTLHTLPLHATWLRSTLTMEVTIFFHSLLPSEACSTTTCTHKRKETLLPLHPSFFAFFSHTTPPPHIQHNPLMCFLITLFTRHTFNMTYTLCVNLPSPYITPSNHIMTNTSSLHLANTPT